MSFEKEDGGKELRIAFNRAGAARLIERIQKTLLNGDHLHDFVAPKTAPGALTKKNPPFGQRTSKIQEVQYQLRDDDASWLD